MSAGLLLLLARRAIAAPAIRPRLPSLFEGGATSRAEDARPPAMPPAAGVAERGVPGIVPHFIAVPQLAAPAPPLQDAAQERAAPALPPAVVLRDAPPPRPPPGRARIIQERVRSFAGAPADTAADAGVLQRDPVPASTEVQRPRRGASADANDLPPQVQTERLQPLLAPAEPAPLRTVVTLAGAAVPAQRASPPAPSLAPASPHRSAPAAPAPVEITIGRIDVRAIAEAATPASAPAPARAHALALADYLRQRGA